MCAFLCQELTDEVLKSPASSRVITDGAGYKTPPLEKHDSCTFPALSRSADPQQNSQEGTGGLLSLHLKVMTDSITQTCGNTQNTIIGDE